MRKISLIIYLLAIYIPMGIGQFVKPVVLISGKVYNERNLKPVGGKIVYEVLPAGTEAGIARSNPATGDYKIILPYGKLYGYYALVEGYYSVTQNLDVTTLSEYKEITEINLFLAPVEKDQVVRLNNIFFEGKTAKLKPESNPELNRLLEFLKLNKTIEIEICGHTDSVGTADANLVLSKERANAIKTYLIENGIKEQRLTVNGYGETQPIGFNNTTEGRELNNRIEFKVVSLVRIKK